MFIVYKDMIRDGVPQKWWYAEFEDEKRCQDLCDRLNPIENPNNIYFKVVDEKDIEGWGMNNLPERFLDEEGIPLEKYKLPNLVLDV